MTETNKVEINIQGKNFPLVVSKEELKWVKKIESSLNQRISDIQQTHNNINFAECLSLALIASEFEIRSKSKEISQLKESLRKIDSALNQ